MANSSFYKSQTKTHDYQIIFGISNCYWTIFCTHINVGETAIPLAKHVLLYYVFGHLNLQSWATAKHVWLGSKKDNFRAKPLT